MRYLLGIGLACLLLGCAGNARAQTDSAVADTSEFVLPEFADSIVIGGEDPTLDALVRPWLGTKHRLGKQGLDAIDCSGFVQLILLDYLGHRTKRSSADNFKVGDTVELDSLQPGDVVFFANRGKRIDHSGVWIGNGKFAHTSTSHGVIVTELAKDPYWPKRFKGGRRYPNNKMELKE